MDWIHNRQQARGCTLYRHDNTVYFDFVLIPPALCTYNNTTDLGRTVWLLLLSFKFPGDFKRDHSLQTQRMINIHVFHLAIVGNTFCIGYKQKRFKLKLDTVTVVCAQTVPSPPWWKDNSLRPIVTNAVQ